MKKLLVIGALAAAAVAVAAVVIKKKQDKIYCDDDFDYDCDCDCCEGDCDCCENEIPADKAEGCIVTDACVCSEEEILDKVDDNVESDEV